MTTMSVMYEEPWLSERINTVRWTHTARTDTNIRIHMHSTQHTLAMCIRWASKKKNMWRCGCQSAPIISKRKTDKAPRIRECVYCVHDRQREQTNGNRHQSIHSTHDFPHCSTNSEIVLLRMHVSCTVTHSFNTIARAGEPMHKAPSGAPHVCCTHAHTYTLYRRIQFHQPNNTHSVHTIMAWHGRTHRYIWNHAQYLPRHILVHNTYL